MPDHDKDEVARALEQLASGQLGEGGAVPPAPAQPPSSSSRRAAAPAPNRPANPSNAPTSRPVHPPGTTPPPAPRPPGAATNSPSVAPQRAAPQRPAAPARPAAPQQPRTPRPDVPLVEAQPVDEDDTVIVPAPPASAFLPYRTASAAAAKTSPTRLSLRRTLIPILLTCGIILLVLGTMPFFLSEENPLSQLPHWMSFSLWALGVFLLALGVVNMLAVKHLLEAQAAARVGGPR